MAERWHAGDKGKELLRAGSVTLRKTANCKCVLIGA